MKNLEISEEPSTSTTSTSTISRVNISKRRIGSPIGVKTRNDFRRILSLLDPFLDVESILKLRQCSHSLKERLYRPHHRMLCFSSLAGYDGKTLVSNVLPLVLKSIRSKNGHPVLFSLDFTNCSLLKDSSIARICEQIPLCTTEKLSMIESIYLDYCYQVTDRGLQALLTSPLKNLHTLSLKGSRNTLLTGQPFLTDLSSDRWARFLNFSCAFTNMRLSNVTHLAKFLMKNSAEKEFPTKPKVEIIGSYASKCLLESSTVCDLTKIFQEALKTWSIDLLARTSKKIQTDWRDLSSIHPLIELNQNEGSRILVNAPVITQKSEDGFEVWTLPLAVAAQEKQLAVCKLLIKRGADVDCWDHMGRTPLFYASKVGSHDVASLLLQNGGSSMPHEYGGHSALMVAIQSQNVEICKLILEKGAVVNFRAPHVKHFRSPLHYACDPGHFNSEIFSLLLAHTADPNWCSKSNRCTPALMMYKTNKMLLPMLLDSGVGATASQRWVLSEIATYAICRGDLDAIKLLVKTHPSLLNARHHFWGAPQIQCARLGNAEILEFLLKSGCTVNEKGCDETTALHIAAQEGYESCVSVVLRCCDDDCDQVNCLGQTALHLSCLENRTRIVEILLQHGAKINQQDVEMGETPLMMSITGRHEAVAQIIVHHENLLVNLTNYHGQNALYYAMHYGLYSIALALMERGSSTSGFAGFDCAEVENLKKRISSVSTVERRIIRLFLRLHGKERKERWNADKRPRISKLFSSVTHRSHCGVPKEKSMESEIPNNSRRKPLSAGETLLGVVRKPVEFIGRTVATMAGS